MYHTMRNLNLRPITVAKIFELRVTDDGDVEVRRVPEDTSTDNMTCYEEGKLTEKVLSYGVKENEDMWAALATTPDYEWVTV